MGKKKKRKLNRWRGQEDEDGEDDDGERMRV